MSNYAKYKDLAAGDSYSDNTPNSNQKNGGSQQQSNKYEIQNAEHKKYFINNNNVCIVYIYGDYCQPCNLYLLEAYSN